MIIFLGHQSCILLMYYSIWGLPLVELQSLLLTVAVPRCSVRVGPDEIFVLIVGKSWTFVAGQSNVGR